MFNHESPRRGDTFVTPKISRAVATIKHVCKRSCFSATWTENATGATRLSMSKASGELCSLEKKTTSSWLPAKATPCASSSTPPSPAPILDWKQFVEHYPRYERPPELDVLLGDASKAKKILGWEPKVRFYELVRIMVDADMDLLSRHTPREHLGKLP
jgi:GDPmannose 4,6-dehydratase